MRRVTIDPVTRLEGHARVEIFLGDDGQVANAYLIVPELRGFEGFCVGRPAEEMPRITNRICGLCPQAHHIASVKALDAVFAVEPTPAARLIRELFYMAFFVLDHATHFFILAGPDLLLGLETPNERRNLFGVLNALGPALGKQVLATRMRNVEVLKQLGGRGIHPVAGLPGGWSVPVTEAMRRHIEAAARANVEFATSALELFEEVVLGSRELVALIMSEAFTHRTYSMGTVDEANRLNLYDGTIRVVDPEGGELVRYHPAEYRQHIAEHVETWTYLKFPYLRQVGWQGLVDGAASGLYSATPLSRLNAADAMATGGAQEAFEKMYETLGSGTTESGRYRPIHRRLATHWARLVELLYAAERMLELATDSRLTDPDVRQPVTTRPDEGVGCIEAPRGTLTHHYWSDDKGLLTRVNLVVGTTNNHAAMALSITTAARGLIHGEESVSDAVLNQVEMAIRCYDPCLSCATHTLPGTMPMRITLRDPRGRVMRQLSRASS